MRIEHPTERFVAPPILIALAHSQVPAEPPPAGLERGRSAIKIGDCIFTWHAFTLTLQLEVCGDTQDKLIDAGIVFAGARVGKVTPADTYFEGRSRDIVSNGNVGARLAVSAKVFAIKPGFRELMQTETSFKKESLVRFVWFKS